MSAVTEYHDGSSWVDISDRVPLEGWELREDAEEGSTPTSTVSQADGALDFEPHGHRPIRVLEDSSESDDDIVFEGFTWNDDSGRGSTGGQDYEPLSRNIQQQANDANAVWQRPVMRGSDCNRPAETDVARVQWLLGTNEYAIFDDVTTYVHTDSTHNMDANDYRGQQGDQIMRDCAEESGKNWWAKYINISGTRKLVAWYGRDTHTTYDSDLFLTNDPDQWSDDELEAGTSLVWPGQDWKVSRDYSRIYCGIYAQFDGGATFRHDSTTHSAYFGDPGPDSHRVMVVPMSNVHTATRAQARADRMLADIEDPDIHVTATIRLPAAKATMLRSGMRVPILLTHEPEFNDGWKWCRIVNATAKPVSAGEFYDIAIEATPTGPPDSDAPPSPPYDERAFAGAQAADGNLSTLVWDYSGDSPAPGFNANPTVGPLSAILSGGTYTQLTTSSAIVVRVSAQAGFAAVFSAGGHFTMTCTSSVNGVIGTDTVTSSGGGFVSGDANIEVNPYTMVAGEILTFTGTYAGVLAGGGWGQAGDNNTYIRIGRGTHNWGSGGSAEVWVGP